MKTLPPLIGAILAAKLLEMPMSTFLKLSSLENFGVTKIGRKHFWVTNELLAFKKNISKEPNEVPVPQV